MCWPASSMSVRSTRHHGNVSSAASSPQIPASVTRTRTTGSVAAAPSRVSGSLAARLPSVVSAREEPGARTPVRATPAGRAALCSSSGQPPVGAWLRMLIMTVVVRASGVPFCVCPWVFASLPAVMFHDVVHASADAEPELLDVVGTIDNSTREGGSGRATSASDRPGDLQGLRQPHRDARACRRARFGQGRVLAVLASVAARYRPAGPAGPLRSLRLRAAPRALLPFAARVGAARARSMGRRVPPAGSPRLGWDGAGGGAAEKLAPSVREGMALVGNKSTYEGGRR